MAINPITSVHTRAMMMYHVLLAFLALVIAEEDVFILRKPTVSIQENCSTNLSCLIDHGKASWEYIRNGQNQIIANSETVYDLRKYTVDISTLNKTERVYTLNIKHVHLDMEGCDICCFSGIETSCNKLHVKPDSTKVTTEERNLSVYFMIAAIPAVMLLVILPLYFCNYLHDLKNSGEHKSKQLGFSVFSGCICHRTQHTKIETKMVYTAASQHDKETSVAATMYFSTKQSPYEDAKVHLVLDGTTV